MKKTLCMIAAFLLIASMLLSGCGDTKTESGKAKSEESSAVDAEESVEANTDIYDFEKHAGDGVTDIEKIDLSAPYADKVVSYRFSYLSDNNSITAYISIPKSFIESGEKGKCLIFNRGGNMNIGLLDDSSTAQVCCIADRIVVASQYRGANGKGGKDEYGGKDVDDVIGLIDLCESNFSFIDMDDFCAAGVSRGGMMTYMAAARDERIKRIIVVSGLADMFAGYSEREDMRDIIENAIGGTPDDFPEEYEKRSAVCWPEKITVPVLMLHSRGDEQVSFHQAEELSQMLKDNGLDCTFIEYDDDVHGLHDGDAEIIREWLETGTVEEKNGTTPK